MGVEKRSGESQWVLIGGWTKVLWVRRVKLESRRMVSVGINPYDTMWQMDCFDPKTIIYF